MGETPDQTGPVRFSQTAPKQRKQAFALPKSSISRHADRLEEVRGISLRAEALRLDLGLLFG